MSLIEEALRRVKDPLLSPPSPAPPATPPQHQPPAPAHSWTPEEAAPPARSNSPLKSLVSPQTPTSLVAVGVAVLALTVVLLTGGVFWIGTTLRAGGAPAPTAEAPEAVVEGPAVPEPPGAVPQPVPPPAAPAPALPRLSLQEPTPQTWPKLQTSPIVFTPNPLGRLRRKPPPQPLVLTGVVEGLGDPYAVINGSIVGLGERVGDLTLQAITSGAVTLRSDDGEDTVLRVSSR